MIILLSGFAGSGKDTFADWLVENRGYKKYAFADELKKEVSEKMNIPLNYFYDRDLKDKIIKDGKRPRDYLIEYGEKMRNEDINHWIKKIPTTDDKIVISDCRFPNEQKYFPEAITIWIHRKVEKIFDNTSVGPDDCMYVVYNNTDKFDGEYIYKQIDN